MLKIILYALILPLIVFVGIYTMIPPVEWLFDKGLFWPLRLSLLVISIAHVIQNKLCVNNHKRTNNSVNRTYSIPDIYIRYLEIYKNIQYTSNSDIDYQLLSRISANYQILQDNYDYILPNLKMRVSVHVNCDRYIIYIRNNFITFTYFIQAFNNFLNHLAVFFILQSILP